MAAWTIAGGLVWAGWFLRGLKAAIDLIARDLDKEREFRRELDKKLASADERYITKEQCALCRARRARMSGRGLVQNWEKSPTSPQEGEEEP